MPNNYRRIIRRGRNGWEYVIQDSIGHAHVATKSWFTSRKQAYQAASDVIAKLVSEQPEPAIAPKKKWRMGGVGLSGMRSFLVGKGKAF